MSDLNLAIENSNSDTDIKMNSEGSNRIDPENKRFPLCIVWTPLPIISWILPFIGHMGIATSAGVIRDFAGPYYVSENEMAFGWPTRYWQLDLSKISTSANRREVWDRAVADASDEYKTRMHNLCCDNCHSHVAMALNLMEYDKRTSWNMVNLCFLMLFKGSFVGFGGFLKTWLPFTIIAGLVIALIALTTSL